MPGYRGHLCGAIIPTFFILATMLLLGRSLLEGFLAVLFCFLGSLAPDIDVSSRARSLFVALSGMFIFYSVIVSNWFLLLALFFVVCFVFQQRHRALLHRFWFWILVFSFFLIFFAFHNPQWFEAGFAFGGAFLLGVLSHLYLDGCRLF